MKSRQTPIVISLFFNLIIIGTLSPANAAILIQSGNSNDYYYGDYPEYYSYPNTYYPSTHYTYPTNPYTTISSPYPGGTYYYSNGPRSYFQHGDWGYSGGWSHGQSDWR